MAASQKRITPVHGNSRTDQTGSAPVPQPKPQSDPTSLRRTGASIPRNDVLAESGWSAVEMTPGVPARNTPLGALSASERALPVVPPPKVPPRRK